MTASTDRKVVVALMVIVCACLIGLGGSLYRIKSAELGTLRQELVKKQAERAEVTAKIARMPQLEAADADLKQRLAILEPSLPDRAYIPTFLRQIEDLAGETANGISEVRPDQRKAKTAAGAKSVRVNSETGEVVKDDKAADKGQESGGKSAKSAPKPPPLPYGFVPIKLKLQGTYWSQLTFLKRLQQFPKMIAVNSVSFMPDTKADGSLGSGQALAAEMELTAVVSETKADQAKGERDGKAS